MSRWADVRRWRDHLRDAPLPHLGVSPAGARLAVEVAVDELHDVALAEAAAIPGRAFRTATFVAARTVPTAPIEWLAVLLGRGTAVTLKHPHGDPGLAPLLASLAAEQGLPLKVTDDRAAVRGAELVVAMGDDATIAAIRAELSPTARYLPHGHAWSAAWVTGEGSWSKVAEDLALHDSRGCLTAALVLTPLPLEKAADLLAVAMARAEEVVPVGRIDPEEAIATRSRRALARVTGTVREGAGWSVHGVGAAQASSASLPRSAQVVAVPDLAAATSIVAPWAALSTVGTDDPTSREAWFAAGAMRICDLGRMQRPPLNRSQDGEDWLRATLRYQSIG